MKRQTPMTRPQFCEAAKMVTPSELTRLREQYGHEAYVVLARLGHVYRQTHGGGRRCQAIVARARKVGLVV